MLINNENAFVYNILKTCSNIFDLQYVKV